MTALVAANTYFYFKLRSTWIRILFDFLRRLKVAINFI